MSVLLDTMVVSEAVKPNPDPNVTEWLAETDEDRIFLSVASLAEIRRGIELMPAGRRHDRFVLWLTEELPARFGDRIIPIDQRVAETWGIVAARGHKAGVTVDAMDVFFAATVEAHGLTLATRNVRHFEALGIALLNPWEPGASARL